MEMDEKELYVAPSLHTRKTTSYQVILQNNDALGSRISFDHLHPMLDDPKKYETLIKVDMPEGPPRYRSQRYILAYVLFTGMMNIIFQRVNLSIAIVCMVNDTYNDLQNAKSISNATIITIATTTIAPIKPHSSRVHPPHRHRFKSSYFNDSKLKDGNVEKAKFLGSSFVRKTLSLFRRDADDDDDDGDDGDNRRCVVLQRDANREDGPLKWDKNTQGLLLGAIYWTYMACSIPGVTLMRSMSRKTVTIVAVGVMSVTTLLTHGACLLSPWALFAIKLVQGGCTGFSIISMYGMWAKWAPPVERTGLVSFCFSGSLMANALVFPLSGVLCRYGFLGGWPSVFYVFGFMGILWCVLCMFVTSESPADHPRITEEERDYIETSLSFEMCSDDKIPKTPWLSLLMAPPVWAIICSQISFAWGLFLLLSTLPQYMREVLMFDIDENGLFSMMPYLAMWINTAIAGQMANCLIENKTIRLVWIRKLYAVIANILPALLLIGVSFMDCALSTFAVFLLTFAIGLTGFHFSSFLINPYDIAPLHAEAIHTMSNTISLIPGIVTPNIVAHLTVDQTREQWQKVFFITAGIYLFGTLAYCIMGKAERLKIDEPSQTNTATDQLSNYDYENMTDSQESDFQEQHQILEPPLSSWHLLPQRWVAPDLELKGPTKSKDSQVSQKPSTKQIPKKTREPQVPSKQPDSHRSQEKLLPIMPRNIQVLEQQAIKKQYESQRTKSPHQSKITLKPQESQRPKSPHQSKITLKPQESQRPKSPHQSKITLKLPESQRPKSPHQSKITLKLPESQRPKSPHQSHITLNPQESQRPKSPHQSQITLKPQESQRPKSPHQSQITLKPQESQRPKSPHQSHITLKLPESQRPKSPHQSHITLKLPESQRPKSPHQSQITLKLPESQRPKSPHQSQITLKPQESQRPKSPHQSQITLKPQESQRPKSPHQSQIILKPQRPKSPHQSQITLKPQESQRPKSPHQSQITLKSQESQRPKSPHQSQITLKPQESQATKTPHESQITLRLQESKASQKSQQSQITLKPQESKASQKSQQSKITLKPQESKASQKSQQSQITLKPQESKASQKSQQSQITLKPQESKVSQKPDQSQITLKPQESKASQKPQQSQITLKPQESKASQKPQQSQITLKPQESKASQKPQQSQITLKPQESKASQKPQQSQITLKPQESKASQKPQQSKITLKPQESKASQKPQQSQITLKPQESKVSQKPQQSQITLKPQESKASQKPQQSQITLKPQESKASQKPQQSQITLKPQESKASQKPQQSQITLKPQESKVSQKPDQSQITLKPQEPQTSKKQKESQTPKKPQESQAPRKSQEEKVPQSSEDIGSSESSLPQEQQILRVSRNSMELNKLPNIRLSQVAVELQKLPDHETSNTSTPADSAEEFQWMQALESLQTQPDSQKPSTSRAQELPSTPVDSQTPRTPVTPKTPQGSQKPHGSRKSQ